ncbi:MAG: glutamate--tRNA ligase [Candidatus Kapabacteria bacterium]|nr:glutamate--tRNA ligase [Candidatus Kapabacteria bacterium]
MSVRVRFAPSPTGFLHVGSLRTTLYNYLFARHHGGTFILRVEDTDQERFVPGSYEDILASLQWAGMTPDESPETPGDCGPYIQSQRTELYRRYATDLIERGMAYYAFDTAEELTAMRDRQKAAGVAPRYDRSSMRNQYTLGEEETKRLLALGEPASVRMKVPITGEVKFNDVIRGTIVVPCKDVDDQILMKSDNFPTYHLANVVDDHEMRITHVIRGEEWLPSTPKHVLLYEAFGWEAPKFAHLPLLLNSDKTKLSKRQGDVAVRDYIAKGYFQEAFINFMALLGWNPSGNREIYSMDELIKEFNLDHVNKAGAVFDLKKLDWMNSQYMKQYVEHKLDWLTDEFMVLLAAQGIETTHDYAAKVIRLLHERITLLPDLVRFSEYMFRKPVVDEEWKATIWNDGARQLLGDLHEIIASVDATSFDSHTVHEAIGAYTKEKNVKFKDVGNTLRLAVTGKSVGAGMMDTIALLGKEETTARISGFLASN